MKTHELYNRKRIEKKYDFMSSCSFIGLKEKQDLNKNYIKFINDVLSYENKLSYIEKINLDRGKEKLIDICFSYLNNYISNLDLINIADEYTTVYIKIIDTTSFFKEYFNKNDTLDLFIHNESKQTSITIKEDEYDLFIYVAKCVD